jgi:hypothetical protein
MKNQELVWLSFDGCAVRVRKGGFTYLVQNGDNLPSPITDL